MRNYLFSIAAHVALFLLLLSWVVVPEKNMEVQQVIIVDFSHSDEDTKSKKKQATKTQKPKVKKKVEVKPTAPNPAPKKTKSADEAVSKKKSSKSSQKLKVTEQKAAPKAQDVKKVVPISTPVIDPQQAKIAAEKAKQQAKKNEFLSLLDKSYAKAGANSNTDIENEAAVETTKVGKLGKRRVIKTPTINDTSQKQGRVAVKICVNAAGKVISSEFTQVGSTTSDPLLVDLATKGAKEYLFTSSPNAKECGRVTIEFKLK